MFSQFDNEEVESYFNRLNAQLKKMPPDDRAEMHQEIRQHLEALAAAHEELGVTPRESAEAALRQFGDPTKIGRRMQREWRQSRRGKFRGRGHTSLAVFSLFLLAWLPGLVIPYQWYAFSGIYQLALMPTLIGGLTSLFIGRSAVKITLRTLSFILTPFALYFAYDAWWSGYDFSKLQFCGFLACCWLPLGGLSAWLGGKAKARIDKRRASTP